MSRVSDLLAIKGSAVYTIDEEKSVYDAIKQMVENNVGALIVTKEDKACGIFTERDYLRRIVLEGRTSRDTRVGDVKTARLIVVEDSRALEECMTIMSSAKIRHLPVVVDGQLAGILSIGDIIKHLSKERKAEIRYLTDYITGKYPA